MSLKILIDMNLSPEWREVFQRTGWEAVHWSAIGEPTANDRQLMAWAQANGYVVFTHDLDFGAILAATRAAGPSMIQLRVQNILPETLGNILVAVIRQHSVLLEAGALMVVDHGRERVRLLPLN